MVPSLCNSAPNLLGFSKNRGKGGLQFKRSVTVQGTCILCSGRPRYIRRRCIGMLAELDYKALENMRNYKGQRNELYGTSQVFPLDLLPEVQQVIQITCFPQA